MPTASQQLGQRVGLGRRRGRRVLAAAAALLLLGATLLPGVTTPALARWSPHLEIEAKPGTQRSLASMQIFYPLFQSEDSLLFADLRGVLSSDPSREGNVGVGYRRILPGLPAVFGAYAFYDVRRTASGNVWRQGTVGLELLGEEYEARLNAYLPEAGRKHAGQTLFSDFVVQGTTLVYQDALIDSYETAMSGFDVELGRRVATAAGNTRVYLAGFHFTAPGVTAITGGRFGIETRQAGLFSQWPHLEVAAGAEVQADNVRGTQAFLSLGLRLPFGAGEDPDTPAPAGPGDGATDAGLRARMTDPVRRDIDVVTGLTEEREVLHEEAPVNPLTGLPVGRLWFFSARGAGDGSMHDPAGLDLVKEESEPGDILIAVDDGQLIHTGDGGLVLKPVQLLTSAGGTLWLEVPDKGMKAFQPTGRPGVLTNDAGTDIVTLSSYNTVSGARFHGGRSAVAGLVADGADGAHRIQDNVISGTRGSAVSVTAAPGDKAGFYTLDITGNRISGPGSSAILVALDAETLQVAVHDNIITGTDNTPISITGSASDPRGALQLSVNGNEIDGSPAEGIVLNGMGPSVRIEVANNTIRDTEGVALAVDAIAFGDEDTGTVTGTLGEVSADALGEVHAGVDLRVSGNRIENAGSAGIFISATTRGDDALTALVISGNRIDTVQDTGRVPHGDVLGIFVGTLSEGAARIDVAENVVDNVFAPELAEEAEVKGIEVTTVAAGVAEVNVTGNGVRRIVTGGQHGSALGIAVSTQAGEQAAVQLRGNAVESVHALDAAGDDRSTVTGIGALIGGVDDESRASLTIAGNVVTDLKGTMSPKGITVIAPMSLAEATVDVSDNVVGFMWGSTTTDGIMVALLYVPDASVRISGNGVSYIHSGADATGVKFIGLGLEGSRRIDVEASGNTIAGIRACAAPQGTCSGASSDGGPDATGMYLGVTLLEGSSTLLVKDNELRDLDSAASDVRGLHVESAATDELEIVVSGNSMSALGGQRATAALIQADAPATRVSVADNSLSVSSSVSTGVDVHINALGQQESHAAVDVRGNTVQQVGTGLSIRNGNLATTEAWLEANTITASHVGIHLSTPEDGDSLIEATVAGNEIEAPTPVETVGNVIVHGLPGME